MLRSFVGNDEKSGCQHLYAHKSTRNKPQNDPPAKAQQVHHPFYFGKALPHFGLRPTGYCLLYKGRTLIQNAPMAPLCKRGWIFAKQKDWGIVQSLRQKSKIFATSLCTREALYDHKSRQVSHLTAFCIHYRLSALIRSGMAVSNFTPYQWLSSSWVFSIACTT